MGARFGVGLGWLGENGAWLLLVRAMGCGCANDHALLAGPVSGRESYPSPFPTKKTTHTAPPRFFRTHVYPTIYLFFPSGAAKLCPEKNHKKPKDNSEQWISWLVCR